MIIYRLFSKLSRSYSSVATSVSINIPSMNVINIKDSSSYHEHVQNAVNALLGGSVIALPTDTIYGLAAVAQNDKAIEDIYNIKQRNPEKPLAICIGDVEDIYLWGKITVSDSLLKDLLPGPVTLIFERTKALNPNLNPDTNLVGIRIPNYPFIQDVVKGCRAPIALTSANVTSEKSPLCVNEFEGLWCKLEKIYDGGKLGNNPQCRRGSTIVDLSVEGYYKLVRRGSAFLRTTKILRKYGLKRSV